MARLQFLPQSNRPSSLLLLKRLAVYKPATQLA